MDSGRKGQAWVENLRHRFSTFCSEADEIISQNSVQYVRTKLITAGENLMHLCTELVEDVLQDLSEDSAGENGLASPVEEQDVNFPAQKMLSICNDTEEDGKSCPVNSASTLLSIKPVGERCSDIQSDGKALLETDEVSNCFGKEILDGDECNVHAYSSTSGLPPAGNSSETEEESEKSFLERQGYELPDDEVNFSSSGSTTAILSNGSTEPSCCQKLEESIIMVDSVECYSDLDMEANHISLKNTKEKFCTLTKKTASVRPVESGSQGIYSGTDRMNKKCCTELPCAKDTMVVNDDFPDWEII